MVWEDGTLDPKMQWYASQTRVLATLLFMYQQVN